MSPSAQRTIPAILAAALCLFAWPVLRMMVSTYETIPDFSHGYLVPLISLYAWRVQGPAAHPRAWMPGLVVLLAGISGMLLALWYQRALLPGGLGHVTLGATGWVLALYGLALTLYGLSAFRHHLFSWLFLLFLIPMPDSLTNRLTLPMRGWISRLAELILQLLGIDLSRDGNILHLAGASLGVESACSGIRSLWMMLAAGVALAFIAGCRKRGWLLVLIASVGLAFLQNLLRVVLTAILVNVAGVRWAQGIRHEAMGWLSFLLALSIMLWLALRLRRREGPPPTRQAIGALPRPMVGVAVWIGILIIGGLFLRSRIQGRYIQRDDLAREMESMRAPLVELPTSIGPFTRSATLELHEGVRNILSPTDLFFGLYADADGFPVRTIILYWHPLDARTQMQWVYPHSPDICFPGSGWKLDEQLPTPEALQHPREWLIARLYTKPSVERMTIYWHNKTLSNQGPHAKPSYRERWQAMRNSWSNPLQNTGIQYSVAVYVDVANNRSHAEAVAQNFCRALLPVLKEHRIAPENVWVDAR